MFDPNVERGDPPPREYRGFIRRVKPGSDVHCVVVSPQFWITWIHYQGRSIPCFKSRGKCPGCTLQLPRKFLGYLYIFNQESKRHEHLELPRDAANDLRDMLGGKGELRGTRFHVKRKGGAKGTLVFDLKSRIEEVAPGFDLGPDKDPKEILAYLWGVNVGKLKLFSGENFPEDEAV